MANIDEENLQIFQKTWGSSIKSVENTVLENHRSSQIDLSPLPPTPAPPAILVLISM